MSIASRRLRSSKKKIAQKLALHKPSVYNRVHVVSTRFSLTGIPRTKKIEQEEGEIRNQGKRFFPGTEQVALEEKSVWRFLGPILINWLKTTARRCTGWPIG